MLAHQGGWDEILLVLTPIGLFAGLLWLANSRANKELTRRRQAAATAAPADDRPPRSCPCCGNLTMPPGETGSAAVCPVCLWVDDRAQAADPTVAVGPNRTSLEEARRYYVEIGASEPSAVKQARRPTPAERPPPP